MEDILMPCHRSCWTDGCGAACNLAVDTSPPKRRRTTACLPSKELQTSPFESLTDEVLFVILDFLDSSPDDKKSFSLVCRAFHSAESLHRRDLIPLRADLLPAALARYRYLSHLNLSLCPRVPDALLASISYSLGASLRSINLSMSRSFSHVGLESLAANCAGLAEIDISNATNLDDLAAAAIGRAKNLERLYLARCKMVTDMGIGCVAVGCPKLKLLSLKWCLGVTDLGVGLIAIKCKQIRCLNLSYMQITKRCLPAVLQLPHLENLAIVGCMGINDESLSSIKQSCKSLEVLNMSNSQNVSHTGLSSIISKANGLTELILDYSFPVTSALSMSLEKLSNLQRLKLDGSQITTSGLQSIGRSCVQLTELTLSKCSGVTDDGFIPTVKKLRNLVRLDITCCREITDASASSISTSCTSLVSLRMESCSMISKRGFVLIGQSCNLLEELDFTDNDLDNEGLKAISGCRKLSNLKMGLCFNIDDDGLIHIGRYCPKLQEIDLYRCKGITDAGVSAIALGCPILQNINLSYCREITNDSLISLSKCSNLNTLEVRGCCQVTSSGLTAMALGCKRLVKLDIKKCYDIDDSGIFTLSQVSQNLRQINLSYCSVTDVGILALASIGCLQSMTLLHVRGVTPNGLVATLLACRGLTKVKLHSSFKPFIFRSLLEYIEARGCVFQWRDKPFQVETETNDVWKQKSQGLCVV